MAEFRQPTGRRTEAYQLAPPVLRLLAHHLEESVMMDCADAPAVPLQAQAARN
jgi:hypothetical protein